MKTSQFIIITFLLSASSVFGQASYPFTNCSYICNYNKAGTIYSGTCFFYKRNAKVFIVSCSHVFTGIETYTGTRGYIPDTMTIFYNSKKDHATKAMKVSINLSKFKYYSYYDKPDMMGFEVKPPKDFAINFINGYVDAAYFDKIPDEVYFYGYPSQLQHWGSQNGSLIKGTYRTDLDNIVYDDPAMKRCTPAQVQAILKKIKPFTFLISQAATHGMSGSPVFGKFHLKNKVLYKFMGVVFGTYTNANRSIAINARTAEKYFLNL